MLWWNVIPAFSICLFSQCFALVDVSFSDGAETLQLSWSMIFSGCPLKKLYLGRNIVYSDYTSSSGNSSPFSQVVTLTIENMVTTIIDRAFIGCSQLTDLLLSNSVTEIDVSAFSGCYSLKELVIPASVEEVDNVTFSRCTRLNSIMSLNPILLQHTVSLFLNLI